ncbi:acetyltransferase [Pseudomonas sp. GX19020]|uniref:acetyltransferase n=1 Tax=Pseudomonas sp. GX19020 TaxID=2942277 RepID=UPI002019136E|nr:acetyltransferase [Pseudomonas sp. GX19020]MCL4068785.1 acetyltransferase [Pseudomonas sp. GX19020]
MTLASPEVQEPFAVSRKYMVSDSMLIFRPSTDQDLPRVMEIWRRSVDATHHFLAPLDRRAIEAEVLELFPKLSLVLAADATGMPQGFMFLHAGHLEALFVDPDQHGNGVGRALISRAVAAHSELTTDVNEQNTEALGFYEHIGFVRTGRSSHDGQGRPYPLIHLRYQSHM